MRLSTIAIAIAIGLLLGASGVSCVPIGSGDQMKWLCRTHPEVCR